MSSSSNRELNNILTSINKNTLEDIYSKEELLTSTDTTTISNTIISFNRELSILFCKICSSNLYKDNTIKHLREKHSSIYKAYTNNNLITNLKEILETLENPSFNNLLTRLGSNSYFFRDLNIIYKGFKCYECLYTNSNPKQIRKHFNKEHRAIGERTRSNTKAIYILENIPLQLITSNYKNTRSYFIPKLPSREVYNNVFNSITRAISPTVLIPSESATN